MGKLENLTSESSDYGEDFMYQINPQADHVERLVKNQYKNRKIWEQEEHVSVFKILREKKLKRLREQITECCVSGDIDTMEDLKFTKKDLYHQDENEVTPLHIASEHGNAEIVKFLVNQIGKEHVSPINRLCTTPYDYALR